MSGQNKEKGTKNTTTFATSDPTDSLINSCFEALGAWANERNRAYLTADFITLEQFLLDGADLERHILPVLREVGQRGKIPVLRTWGYFADLITARKLSTIEDAASSDEERKEKSGQQHTSRLGEDKASGDASSDDLADNEMRVFLRKVVKRGPRPV